MSRIFEALKLTQGELADAVVPALDGPVAARDEAPGARAVNRNPKSEVDERVPQTTPAAGDLFSRVLRLALPEFSPVLPFDGPNSRASEQYRVIRTRIIQHPIGPRVIVVSSPGPGDGKSLTAVNLAGALSLKGRSRVLLVDADFRQSSIHTQIGFPEGPGLADVLAGSCSLEQAVIRTEQLPALHVLTAGERRSNPAELLDSPQWAALCLRMRELFAHVIVDSPPMSTVADYDLIRTVCDGVIVVVRPDHTNRTACFDLIDKLPKKNLLGVVMNCVTEWFTSRNSYEGYYYQV